MTVEFQLSTTQKGKIGESLVASTLMLASNGRLSPYAPHSDDCGIDLIVLDKKTSQTLCVQVKGRSRKEEPQSAQFNIRKISFRNSPNCYLLAFFFNPRNPALSQSWFIPMDHIPKLAVEKPDRYSMAPSTALNSNDRYISYRRENVEDLVTAIIEMLDPAQCV